MHAATLQIIAHCHLAECRCIDCSRDCRKTPGWSCLTLNEHHIPEISGQPNTVTATAVIQVCQSAFRCQSVCQCFSNQMPRKSSHLGIGFLPRSPLLVGHVPQPLTLLKLLLQPLLQAGTKACPVQQSNQRQKPPSLKQRLFEIP